MIHHTTLKLIQWGKIFNSLFISTVKVSEIRNHCEFLVIIVSMGISFL